MHNCNVPFCCSLKVTLLRLQTKMKNIEKLPTITAWRTKKAWVCAANAPKSMRDIKKSHLNSPLLPNGSWLACCNRTPAIQQSKKFPMPCPFNNDPILMGEKFIIFDLPRSMLCWVFTLLNIEKTHSNKFQGTGYFSDHAPRHLLLKR